MSIKAIEQLHDFISKRDAPSGLSIREIKDKIAHHIRYNREEYYDSARAAIEDALVNKTYAISDGREIERIKVK